MLISELSHILLKLKTSTIPTPLLVKLLGQAKKFHKNLHTKSIKQVIKSIAFLNNIVLIHPRQSLKIFLIIYYQTENIS